MNTQRCRSCNKPIIWTVTERGRRMPVDPEKVLGGNISVTVRGEFFAPLSVYVKPNPQVMAHLSHFATCPNAAQHRKKS